MDWAILVIRDNGRGFDPESMPPERLGIRIMLERTEEIGAALTVEIQPGDGTEITVEWTKDERRRMTEPGAIVGTASHADALLALIQTACPDLVLLDWDMPGQPLAEVLAQVQSADPIPKIIILSKDAEVRGAALAAGADAFVIKGDPPKQLLVAFDQVSSQS